MMLENECLNELSLELRSLAVFRALLKDETMSMLMKYMDTLRNADVYDAVDAYGEFIAALFKTKSESLASYVMKIVSNDENIYMHYQNEKSIGKEIPASINAAVEHELEILQKVADLTPEELRKNLEWNGFLPEFAVKKVDIKQKYFNRVDNISKYGYGIYAKHHMFFVDGKGHIVPVFNPDTTKLCDLVDYEYQRNIILQNTKALLAGLPAANVLLTGDAGTGKSSTVKAVVNELYTEGLRILEVRKEQLHFIPAILDELNQNPLKFILFIDDLSFQKDDDNYSALKAVLEGSVSAKSQNVVIYATSNRRHLVKEKFSDREGDDVHANDTMQEIISLSERFGIQLTFERPNKDTYLDIVHHLVKIQNLNADLTRIDAGAERFALSRGSRSARAAKQYVDSLVSGIDL